MTDSVLSPSGRFMIFYDAIASDTDSITAPAFVESARNEVDSAYAFEIDSLGYTPPQFTEGTHYNIYIAPVHINPDTKLDYYGATYPLAGGDLTPGPSGVDRTRTFIAIDNSFNSVIYATHGLNALRITIFHEFFHMVQFSGYAHPPSNEIFIQEMSSVWMEWLSTPNVKDYLNYVWQYLSTLNTEFDFSPSTGYGQYIYFAYLTHRFNDTGFVKQIWEYYRDSSNDPMACIEHVLEEHGTNFCSEYERFGTELMQAGSHYNGSSLLPDAQLLPTDTIQVNLLAPDASLAFVTNALSLQFAGIGSCDETCIEIIARDTNRDEQSNATIAFTGLGSPALLTLDDPAAYCDTELCQFFLASTSPGLQVFPDPFVSNGSDSVYILASSCTQPIAVVMNIMDLNMNEVRSTKFSSTTLAPYKGSWNATWDGRDDNGKLVASGEYLYSLHVDGALKVGKIVVVRK